MGWLRQLLFGICLAGLSVSGSLAGTVLLTIDAEKDSDPQHIATLDLQVPATYFLLGEFANRNLEMVRKLAANNTIGAHGYSHESLLKLPRATVEAELTLTRIMLEEATGRPVTWFRAPFLDINDEVREVLKKTGYLFDSSETEDWARDETLFSLPISVDPVSGTLLSDYDLFEKGKMTDAEVLGFLEQQYDLREKSERPLVILLHPSIIVEHRQVLLDFIDYVGRKGGIFQSVEQWLERYREQKPSRVGVWIDLSVGMPDLDDLNANLGRLGATDVFLMARDHDGYSYFDPQADIGKPNSFAAIYDELRGSDVRVHAWLPVLLNPALAQMRPELAMVKSNGIKSIDWLSPGNPGVIEHVQQSVEHLLSQYKLDGIHLDYIRYPDQGHGFAQTVVDGFFDQHPELREKGEPKNHHGRLLSDFYTPWHAYRAEVIAGLVDSIRGVVERYKAGGRDIELSAALIAQAALREDARNKFGQDYSRLADSVDLFLPMAYFKSEQRPLDWISRVIFSTRFKIGDRQLMTGLLSYQQPEHWRLTDRELEKSVELGLRGTDGIAFYNYLNLFGEDENDSWNMPGSSVAAIRSALDSAQSSGLAVEAGTVGQKDPPELPAEGGARWFDALAKMDRADTWLILLGFVGLIAVVVFKIRRRDTQSLSVGAGPDGCKEMVLSPDRLRELQNRIERSRNIPGDMLAEVRSILNCLGARKISFFKQIHMLDLMQNGKDSINSILEHFSERERSANILRDVEELDLLGYVQIEADGALSVTDLGRQVIDQGKAQGYSKTLIEFIDSRLAEDIVISCPHCDARTLGQWFWKTFECSGCHKKTDITKAANVFVRH